MVGFWSFLSVPTAAAGLPSPPRCWMAHEPRLSSCHTWLVAVEVASALNLLVLSVNLL